MANIDLVDTQRNNVQINRDIGLQVHKALPGWIKSLNKMPTYTYSTLHLPIGIAIQETP